MSFEPSSDTIRSHVPSSGPGPATLALPVLLRVPRLARETTMAPLVLPPLPRVHGRGRLLAGVVIVFAFALVMWWQRWFTAPRHVPPTVRSTATEELPTLPPLRVQVAPPPPTAPPRLAPASVPVVRPVPVQVRAVVPLPQPEPMPHPIIVSVEPGDNP